MASGPKGRSTLILAWKMTTRTLVSALRHLLPGASDSATAASEPMCSKSSECIFRGGGAGEPAGDDSSSSTSSPSAFACWNPSAGFSATIICEATRAARIKDRAGGSAQQCRDGRGRAARQSAERRSTRALGPAKAVRSGSPGPRKRRRMDSAIGLGFGRRAAPKW